jgi:N-acetyl-alpha-D-muramate 1-phosphate uridylyltransferase
MKPFPLMMFAAGFGKRMGALTANRPKPLIQVAGRALIDHALAVAEAAKIEKTVINLHFFGDQLRQHLSARPDIVFSDETDRILETGGGLRNALPLLGDGPVLTLNTDAVWTGQNPLIQLMQAWDPARMDGLLLLLPMDQALGHGPKADFAMTPTGQLLRGHGNESHVYLGAQILKTTGLSGIVDQVFSMNVLWNQMIADGRAYGVTHQGGWCDVGSPAGLVLAEHLLLVDRAG